MKRALCFLASSSVLLFYTSCAPLTPELPSGDEQQLDRPATLSATPIPRNPLDPPDEATQPYVPGQ